MAPRGGYSRNRARGVEYVPVQDTLDAEGKLMARDMGQEYPVWVADAIVHPYTVASKWSVSHV